MSEEDDDEDSFVPVCPRWQLRNPECVVSRITWRDWRVRESAWHRWHSFYEDSRQRRFSSNVHEDTSDSDCDSPRSPIRDFRSAQDLNVLDHAWYLWLQFVEHRRCYSSSSFCSTHEDTSDSGCDSPRSSIREFQSTQDLRVLDHAWYRWLQFVEQRRCYSDGFSDDSFVECEYDHDPLEVYDLSCGRLSAQDSSPYQHNWNSWRSDCTISVAASDFDGTWELPSLTASDGAGELEMIRYAICLSTMAFEEDAAAAVSWEHEVSLLSRLERARVASQMASLKHQWDTSRGHLRRQHITRKMPGNLPTKRGRRQHKHDLRRARANRKMGMTDNPRPAQPEPQFRSAFSFAPPTAPTIPLTATKDVFIFGAAAQSTSLSTAFAPTSSPATLSPSLSSLTSSSSELSSSSSSSSFSKYRNPSPVARRQPQWVKSDGSYNQRCALQRSAKSSIDPRSHGRGKCDRPKVSTQSDRSEPEQESSSTATRVTVTAPVPVLLALTFPMNDSSIYGSEQASAASTVPLLITLLSLLRGSRSDLPRHRRRKARDCTSNWHLPQFSATDTDFGKHHRQPRAPSLRCTRAHMKALGRSRWLNGLCRCLHSGCTNGTGPRPSIEP